METLQQEMNSMTTDESITDIVERINILIGWAESDYESSIENNSKSQAKDDKIRIKNLQKAALLLNNSYKNF